MTQTVFTVITEVDPARLDELRAVVRTIGLDPVANAVLPLGGFATLHYASLVVIEADKLPATLIFEHNVDGSAEAWLATLASEAAAGLDRLYSPCLGYPAGQGIAAVGGYLTAHIVRPGAYHVGATGRSVVQIGQEAALRDAIEAFLDDQAAAGGLGSGPGVIRSSIQSFLRDKPEFAWARTTPPRQPRFGALRNTLRLAVFAVIALVALVPLLPVVLVAVGVLRIKELTDHVQQGAVDATQVAAVSAAEDFLSQNHLASVIEVKRGLLRKALLPAVLYALNLYARAKCTTGKLGGIPSIHFAHWSMINRGRHLLFLSNFDGSWESYLGDFIDKAHNGLTAVWSNTIDYPRTRFLLGDGATDGPQFRQWARGHQCPTGAWYCAYPESTMTIIDNNTAIREGLFGTMRSDEEVRTWLGRL